ncbi:MAG: PadR family transcriptional regulator [Longimicrobiales bacterium]
MPRRDPEALLPLKPKPFHILLALEEGGPLHGYAINKSMGERSGGTVSMDPGGLYRLIARLERDGLLGRTEAPPDETDERRQYVDITDWGRAVLRAEARRIAGLAALPSVRDLAGPGA